MRPADLPLIDAREASRLLCVPVATVRQLAREGRIPSVKVGRRVLFSRGAIEERVTRAMDDGQGI